MKYQPPEWIYHSTYKGWTIEHRPELKRRSWRIQGKNKQVFNTLEKCIAVIDKRTTIMTLPITEWLQHWGQAPGCIIKTEPNENGEWCYTIYDEDDVLVDFRPFPDSVEPDEDHSPPPKQRTSIQLSAASRRQIDWLSAQGFGNLSEVLALAIHQMYVVIRNEEKS